MKLYTEEQVRTMLDLSKLNVYGTKIYSKDELIEQQKPIELPSDEEIYNVLRGKKMFEKDWGFIEGAKWMREQILNQNQ